MRDWLGGAVAVLALGVLLGMVAVGLALRTADPAGSPAGALAGDPGAAGPADEREEDRRAGPARDTAASGGQGPGPAASAAAEPAPPADPAPETLVAHLEARLASDDVRGVERLSVLVVDEEGRTLAAHQPELAVTPASTTKLVTAAAALRLLGPDYRYVTRAYATGDVTDGVLHGDLIVVGSGDPALASPVYAEQLYPARPHTLLDDLAAAIEAAGVTEVRGAVRGDPRVFADEPVAQGWADRYFSSLNTARVSGLTVDAGRRLFERDEVLLAELAENPATRAAEVLAELLVERGVVVRGGHGLGSLPLGAEEVARLRSPPLRDLLAHLVQASDNQMADAVFRTLGALAGGGTWADSDAITREALAGLDLQWGEASLADGSGLSRDARLSARTLVGLDVAMTARHPEEWGRLLAVAGESGTLRGRLVGTPAEGRLAGKTGALRDARGLVAQVAAPDARRYHFAVLGSDLDGAGIQTARTLMDEIALLLTSDPPACWPDESDQHGRCP